MHFSGCSHIPAKLAATLIAVCPDIADQADAPLRRASPSETVRMIGDELTRCGQLFLWWD